MSINISPTVQFGILGKLSWKPPILIVSTVTFAGGRHSVGDELTLIILSGK